jgi:ABC-2 type transport system permease protein
MIVPVARNRFLNLRRDRAALVLSFVLPVAFFSIFAGVFAGGSSRATTRKIRVAVVDQDGSENSRRFVEALRAEEGLTVVTAPAARGGKAAPPPYTEPDAAQAVRSGEIPVALVIPKGFGRRPIVFGPGPRPTLQVLSDSSDPIAPQLLIGLVQKAALSGMPDVMAREGMGAMAQFGGDLTPEQQARMEENIRALKPTPGAPAAGSADGGGLIDVEVRDLVGETKKNPTVAFYAAGLGVMFLLFTAAGAGGALIEEVETGTLDRILATRVSMGTFLGGKLLYLTALAVTQLTVMFLWGAVFFGLELANHLPGFFVMAVSTALCRLGLRPAPRGGLPVADAARRALEPRDPRHVGPRRQHVPALPHAREHAEDRAHHVERLGSGRVPEGLLERRAAREPLAASRCSAWGGRVVLRRRAPRRAPLGSRLAFLLSLGTVPKIPAAVPKNAARRCHPSPTESGIRNRAREQKSL